MTIKEAENLTGLTRSNIRFYEKEELITPSRNDKNGYRDYSEKDIETIKKIAFLRTLDIPVEDIRYIIAGKISLIERIEKQTAEIQTQLEGLHKAKSTCERMLADRNVSFADLQIEKYVTDPQTYWDAHKAVFKLDSVSFLYLWGSLMTWAILTSLCAVVGILSYAGLPAELPVQWNHGTAVSYLNKNIIFLYPIACILIRVWLRPVIAMKLFQSSPYGEVVSEYLSNYICFAALSVEVFSILYVYGFAKSVTAVLLTDTVVLIGLLLAGLARTGSIQIWNIKK